jgi:SAM-dependent methyltransferase
VGEINGVVWDVERIMRAWDYVRIDGRVSGPDLDIIELVCGPTVVGVAAVGPPDGDGWRPFHFSLIPSPPIVLRDCALRGLAGAGGASTVPLDSFDWFDRPGSVPLFDRFAELVSAAPGARLLEVGSRARTAVRHRRQTFAGTEYVGIDVLPGDEVDIVCDAHRMSDVLQPGSFDFACSFDVFEHLAIPWKVVVELNRVLRVGGVVLSVVPQAVGLHDLPWDFWRMSDSGFRALFAPETGFEVLEVARAHPMHLLPFIGLSEVFDDAEQAAGFYSVSVLARKVGETTLDWPVDISRLVEGPYPA